MELIKDLQLAMFLFTMMVYVFAAPKHSKDQLSTINEPRGKRQYEPGVTGPVHTFVKTDKDAHFKWGVRHHAGHHYAGRK